MTVSPNQIIIIIIIIMSNCAKWRRTSRYWSNMNKAKLGGTCEYPRWVNTTDSRSDHRNLLFLLILYHKVSAVGKKRIGAGVVRNGEFQLVDRFKLGFSSEDRPGTELDETYQFVLGRPGILNESRNDVEMASVK